MSDVPVHVLVDLASQSLNDASVDRILASITPRGDDAVDEPICDRVRVVIAGRTKLAEDGDPRFSIVSNETPSEVARRALDEAARRGARLLVLFGAALPSRRGLAELGRALDRDPYFAFALPRVSLVEAELLAKLDDRYGDPEIASIPESVMDSLPESMLVDDVLFSAVLIDAPVVRDFEPLDPGPGTLWGAIRELMARARRVGFRTVVSNRASVWAPCVTQPDAHARADLARIEERYPEVAELERDWARAGFHEYESLLARSQSASLDVHRTLLIDLTDLGAMFNGTSEAVTGLLWGLKALKTDWRISLWVAPHVAAFHGIERYFPEMERVWPEPRSRFTAVFRPIQPWSLQQIERLHRLGLFVFVMMFDTILAEGRVGAPPALDAAWRTLARVADGLFYISRFTRDRFRTRYPVDPSVSESVTLLSAHPGDYCASPAEGSDEYIFVVGNRLVHKWLEPTIRDLSEAFPYQPLKALGFESRDLPQVSGIPSGETGQDAVDRLYREARLIVYPSQYEGFGIPVIRGLANGRTVVARRTDLLEELAANYRGPGTLHAYETRAELVERVAEVLHGVPREGMVLGADLAPDVSPASQVDVARQVLAMIEDRVGKAHASNWHRRQEVFEFAASYLACADG